MTLHQLQMLIHYQRDLHEGRAIIQKDLMGFSFAKVLRDFKCMSWWRWRAPRREVGFPSDLWLQIRPDAAKGRQPLCTAGQPLLCCYPMSWQSAQAYLQEDKKRVSAYNSGGSSLQVQNVVKKKDLVCHFVVQCLDLCLNCWRSLPWIRPLLMLSQNLLFALDGL